MKTTICAAALASFALAGSALADEISATVNNYTSYDFTNATVVNQDHATIESVPSTIAAGQSGTVMWKNENDNDDLHVDIHWSVTTANGQESVGIIYKIIQEASPVHECRVDVPDDIQGDHGGCGSNPHYRFTDKTSE